MAATAPINVRDLHKNYGSFVAVDSLDLEVHAGEVFALLGPNGAGKTTTVDILVGQQRRSSGHVEVLGIDPGKGPGAWRNRIGSVPQRTAEYTDLTVREIIDHYSAFYSNPIPRDELIAMVGLESKAKTKSAKLSGGQQRRLDVAVGVVGDPEVVFLDEPTTGLDPEARREAWDLVEFFRERGTTTLLTTHYLDEAEALADRAGIIAGGRMLTVGTVQELENAAGAGVTITFSGLPQAWNHLPAALVSQVPDQVSSRGGEPLSVLHTSQPTVILTRLIEHARAVGLDEIPGLTVTRPTLEDTYLRLISQEDAA
ncbi:ABC transporter ATP-binding protein [Demetria terragena]|uniref:ABC transporter ATP-binding protein n=1 Tax=Demetria terragena TaxID=63959 RepID=UPI000369F9D7|nr:ABC transporter ATP-binding protein [Demetria terragena]